MSRSDRSILFQYDVQDFTFDSLNDHDDRHDITADSTHIVPRTRRTSSARDRFTKASDKRSRTVQINRLDLTDRPLSYREATTRVRDRTTEVGVEREARATPIDLSRTLHHYRTHEEFPDRPRGGRAL